MYQYKNKYYKKYIYFILAYVLFLGFLLCACFVKLLQQQLFMFSQFKNILYTLSFKWIFCILIIIIMMFVLLYISGRKKIFLIASFLIFISLLLNYLDVNTIPISLLPLLISSILLFLVVPVYLNEVFIIVTNATLRYLYCFALIFSFVEVSLFFLLVGHHIANLFLLISSVACFILTFNIVESPTYLFKKENTEDAFKTLMRIYYGKKASELFYNMAD